MKQIEKTASAANFAAINLGKLNELGDYLLKLAPEIKIPGKVFGGAALQATGSEFSFLSGNGEFQVDGQVFPVSEGSVVRVAPKGKRSVRNNGTIPLIMLCIQYKAATFAQEDTTDGTILNETVRW